MTARSRKTHDGFIVNPEDLSGVIVRQKRRNDDRENASPDPDVEIENGNITFRKQGLATPPSTPHRTKKRVRFSEPNPTITGLTPFLGRSSISSPPPSRSRRHSTASSRWNLAVDDSPIICGTLQFAPMRQVLDGRVKRRLRRNRLSEEVNTIDAEERCKMKARIAEIELLKEELRQKDQEIQEMKDEQDLTSQIGGEAGIPSLISSHVDKKVKNLELQVTKLRAELQKRELDAPMHDEPNWALAGQDTFDDDDVFLPNYDEDFNAEMTSIFVSTPGRRSFPSPPVTVPNTPNKPTSLNGAQNEPSTTEYERIHLESQLKVLQDELKTLSKTLELTNTTHERLTAKLAPFISETGQPEKPECLDAALDAVLTQLALSDSAALDSRSRFFALSNEVSDLFPSSQPVNPESTLQMLHTQFRAARLELEYLTPGENTEGFENSKLLDMLVSRLRILTKKVQQQDDDIDQYHSEEISLRQQLGSRVDAIASLQEALATSTSEVARLESDVFERDENISKLTYALQGYRDEVSGLETFINRLEVEHAADDTILRDDIEKSKRDAEARMVDSDLKCETLEAAAEGREILMRELERRLSGAVASARALEDAFAALRDENTDLRDTATDREKAHGDALALRDARVIELREEVEAVNAALKRAHDTIMDLTRDRRELEAQVEGEKERGKLVIDAIRGQLARALDTGMGYLSGDVDVRVIGSGAGAGAENSSARIARSATQPVVIPGPGSLFDASLARRRSTSTGSGRGKKRRRYDSGLGFLEEEDEMLESSVCA